MNCDLKSYSCDRYREGKLRKFMESDYNHSVILKAMELRERTVEWKRFGNAIGEHLLGMTENTSES